MTTRVMLGTKAHCRFGDKGDTGLFVIIPFDARDYELILAGVTPVRVAAHLGGLPADRVICRPAPALGALVVVVRSSLQGGVTASLGLDAHGKTRSGYLLGMQVPWDEEKSA